MMTFTLQSYPAYKDSGVPWLGKVPEHWSCERAKRLFDRQQRSVRNEDGVVTCFRDGTVTLRTNRRTEGFTNALKEIGYQGVRKGDLVIHVMDAFAGAIGVSDSDGKCTPVYSVCMPRSGVNARYYAYAVRETSRSGFIQALATGIRERSSDFRYETFGRLTFPLPPGGEQDSIARFLQAQDRLIATYIRAKQKLIALLNEQKQAIIQKAVTRGLNPDVRMKPSGVDWLGDVPEHWQTPLNQMLFRENIRPHHGRSEVQLSLSQRDGLIATSEMEERSLQTSTFDNWKVVLPGDLVVNRFKAHLGVFFAATLRGIVSFHYGVFEPRQRLNTTYFERLYHTRPYKAIYAGRSNGMTIGLQNLSNQNFYGVRSVVPPVSEQDAIVESLAAATSDVDASLARTQRQIALMREYRTRLIADVVTGKVDVRAAAKDVDERMTEEPEVDTIGGGSEAVAANDLEEADRAGDGE